MSSTQTRPDVRELARRLSQPPDPQNSYGVPGNGLYRVSAVELMAREKLARVAEIEVRSQLFAQKAFTPWLKHDPLGRIAEPLFLEALRSPLRPASQQLQKALNDVTEGRSQFMTARERRAVLSALTALREATDRLPTSNAPAPEAHPSDVPMQKTWKQTCDRFLGRVNFALTAVESIGAIQ